MKEQRTKGKEERWGVGVSLEPRFLDNRLLDGRGLLLIPETEALLGKKNQ